MDHDMITDITLDHLPDLSEASVSFQIPSHNASADLLLVDQTDGFDLLYNAVDSDASFAPLAPTNSRGTLTLGELTPMPEATSRPPPRSRSSTPTHVSSAKPSVIQPPLTLGRRRRSPDKREKTTSRITSKQRWLESPLVSSERFDKLRAELETFDEEYEPSSRVHMHVPVEESSVDCQSPSRPCSKLNNGVLDDPLQGGQPLDAVPEEKNVFQAIETPAQQDVVMATDESCPTDAKSIFFAVLAPGPKSKRNPRTIASTIAATDISNHSICPATHVSKKAKSKPSRVQEAQPPLPFTTRQFTPPQSIATESEGQLVPPACKSGDIDHKSENTQITLPGTGGMADRLVSYSQKLISSIGLYRPRPDSSADVSDSAARTAHTRVGAQLVADAQPMSESQGVNDIPGTHDNQLRLSEISPHKPPQEPPQTRSSAHTGTPQDDRPAVMSPMRAAKKRVSTDADLPLEQDRRRKRGKTVLENTDSDRGSSNETVSEAQPRPDETREDRLVSHSETQKGPHLDSVNPTLPSARTKYRPKLEPPRCKGPILDAFPYLSCSRQLHETIDRIKSKRGERPPNVRSKPSLSGTLAGSRLRQDKKTKRSGSASASHARQRSRPTTSAGLPLAEKKQSATLLAAPPTKPVGFTFQVDARLQARKAEERLAASEPGKTPPLHAVPDVKPLRASHQAEFVFHKEGAVPTVPVEPFFFYTEQRAKEREKFDAMMRRKEEEMQRLKVEQQRREAEEEERTIKELRRKAIPKANGVPEWYADMPKRKGATV